MRLARLTICGMLFAFSTFSLADNSEAKKEAARLLNVMGAETAIEQSMNQMMDMQIQQNPTLLPFRHVIADFFEQHMSYESLKPEMVKLYAEEFTASELRELNAFYQTPVGQKTIEKMPVLFARGGQIGVQRVQANIHKLEAMIVAEAERLQLSETQ
ncbi:DUF2059 domain-containing protein [Endozoicomonas atrinae]|uniref:DUF2059 domain-containing protein n=1 Tax=Endozoicomonas atrinae TaxID=1333660 RepID=UPI0008256344|nr:DUF2059 domain-containing protein [Endozoicomonas atrinae]